MVANEYVKKGLFVENSYVRSSGCTSYNLAYMVQVSYNYIK